MHTTDNQQKQHHTRALSLPSPTPDPAMKPLIPGSPRVTADRTDEGTSEMHPLTTPPRWSLSPLDWHAHAIDTNADHPIGLWIAAAVTASSAASVCKTPRPATAVQSASGGAPRNQEPTSDRSQ